MKTDGRPYSAPLLSGPASSAAAGPAEPPSKGGHGASLPCWEHRACLPQAGEKEYFEKLICPLDAVSKDRWLQLAEAGCRPLSRQTPPRTLDRVHQQAQRAPAPCGLATPLPSDKL